MRLDCPVTKSPFLPSSSTICPRNGPKNGQKWPKCALFVPNRPETKNGLYLGLRGSKPNSRGTLSTRNHPLCVVSKPQNGPARLVDPRTSGDLVQPEGNPARAQLGPTVGPPGFPGRKKCFFFKVGPRPLGMLKQVFLGRFEPVVAHFGPWKIPKCLKNGPFQDQKWVKNESKTHFSKSDLGPFGALKQVFFLPILSPWGRIFPHEKSQNALKMGRFGTKNGSKNGSKTCFSISDPGPFGMLRQVFLAHFEPIGTGFGPCKIPI